MRGTLDAAGDLHSLVSYDPWGQVESGTVPTFGFTGELQQGNQVYLRARWYNAATGRFAAYRWQIDESDDITPYSHHAYAYALGNPLLLTDPSGKCSEYGQGDDYCRPSLNPRDLTLWLYRAMIHNSKDGRLTFMQYVNGAAPLVILSPCPDEIYYSYMKGYVFYQFRELMKDHATWDFKHKILERLGPGVTYCSAIGCDTEIEYSVAGNIHFGFIGRAAGFSWPELGMGAAVAEAGDPAHNPNSDLVKEGKVPYVGPYDSTDKVLVEQKTPFGNVVNYGDDPQDNIASTFGMYLFDKYHSSMTYQQFRQELTKVLPLLARHSPDPDPVKSEFARSWPYQAEYFNWP